jgi:hypothetical protein
MRRTLAALSAALFLVCAGAQAHSLSAAHVDIRPAAHGGQEVELDLALRDLALELPLDADHDERITWSELQAVEAPLAAMLQRDFRLSSAAGPCPLRVQALRVRRYDDGSYAALQLHAACPASAGLRLDYALFFDNDSRHRALVTVHRSGGVATLIARNEARALALPDVRGNPFLAFLREGVGHILSGYDHLAFLLSLLLPAPLVLCAGAWRPASDWRAVFWPTLGLVTAFTAAHSISLSLAALGWVRPNAMLVEATIAASVALAALNNLRPLVTRRLWAVGFGFGLVHGLGFAGALLETGLPADARLAALLGFNVGVELGQLAVVAVALPVLYLLRTGRGYPNYVLRLSSIAIAALAGWWLYQRLFP